MADRVALITGVNGQDGSYLAERLVDRGYQVVGTVRRPGAVTPVLSQLHQRAAGAFYVATADLLDTASTRDLLAGIQPHEIYHLAAQTFVPDSRVFSVGTFRDTGYLAVNLLDCIARTSFREPPRVFIASSSEIFARGQDRPLDSTGQRGPSTPYGLAKLMAHEAGEFYRAHGLHVALAVSFNHESPRRGAAFFTQHVVQQTARVLRGEQDVVALGTADAVRDWGWAPEYVAAIHKLTTAPEPLTAVLCTGKPTTTGQLATYVAELAGLSPEKLVFGVEGFKRPAEAPTLGDPAEAERKIGWRAEYDWRRVAREMLEAETGRQLPVVN